MFARPSAVLGAIGVLITVVLSGCSTASAQDAEPIRVGPDVQLDSGPIRGMQDGDVLRYRGIPYAAPPVGERRFAPPEPVRPWTKVRQATESGPACPQVADVTSIQEDCLHLDVTVPAAPAEDERPVLLWVHGGGFASGTGFEYDPRRMATQGDVIVVTVDFRLGALSNMALPSMTNGGSFGQQDQRAALRWVKNNAAAFGGDPDNVTLFGESGGAISTCSQLVAPQAEGLIDRAILQSGTCSIYLAANMSGPGSPASTPWRSSEDSYAATRQAASRLGCPTGNDNDLLACLREVSVEALNGEVNQFNAATFGTPALPQRPDRALADGAAADIPVLAGFTRDEGLAAVYAAALRGKPITEANRAEFFAESFGEQAEAVRAKYPPEPNQPTGGAYADAMTDLSFACPSINDANTLARHGAPVFLYEFADPTANPLIPALPGLPAGASHGSELPYLFDMAWAPLDITTGEKIPLTGKQRKVASDMIHTWTSFARTGIPDAPGLSPPWTYNGLAHVFTSKPRSMELSLVAAKHHCAFWDRHPINIGR